MLGKKALVLPALSRRFVSLKFPDDFIYRKQERKNTVANFGSLLESEPYAQRAMDTEELVAIKEDDEVEEVVEQDVA